MTENTETPENTENTETAVKTRLNIVFINENTEKHEITGVFEHANQKTGEVVKMGEKEVLGRLRIHETRIIEQEVKLKEATERNDERAIEKAQTALENNRKQEQYWKHALNVIKGEYIEKTAENTELREAA